MRRKPILFDKIPGKRQNHLREVIGLVGAHHGAGVTYTGLLLAFYMGEQLGKKTALLECHNHQDMCLFQTSYNWTREEILSFSFHLITCFKEVTDTQIAEILAEDYECIILDFGTDFSKNKEEFLRCNTKIIIGGRAEWNLHKFIQFVKSVKTFRGSNTWIHLIPCADSKTILKLRKYLECNVYAVPFETDPTILSKYSYKLFDKLFHNN